MKSEQYIKEKMKSCIRNFYRSSNKESQNSFLDRAFLLQDILEIPSSEFEEICNEIEVKLNVNK